MRTALATIVVLVFALISGGTTVRGAAPVAQIVSVDDSAFPTVEAVLTLVDSTGQPVVDLQPADVTAQETGASAAVTKLQTVSNQNLGLGVIMTVDTSGSMFGPPLAAAKSAISDFVKNLQPADQVAVLNFASQANLVEGLTADHNAAVSALDGLIARGDTALYSAVETSIKTAQAATLPRKAIVFLSDGKDDGGHSDLSSDQALRLAANAHIPFYVIGLGQDIDRAFLTSLAAQSGGAFLQAPSSADVTTLYKQVAQLLKSQYVVTLNSTADPNVADRSLDLRIYSSAGTLQVSSDYKTLRSVTGVAGADTEAGAAPAPAATGTESSNSSSVLLILLAVLVVGVVVGGGAFSYNRLKTRRLSAQLAVLSTGAVGELQTSAPGEPAPAAPDVSIEVEGPDTRQTAHVGREPATIGTDASNQLRLEDPQGRVAGVHARIWSRDGKLIFHQLSDSVPSLIEGKPVDWATLSPGDEITIGPYRLKVS